MSANRSTRGGPSILRCSLHQGPLHCLLEEGVEEEDEENPFVSPLPSVTTKPSYCSLALVVPSNSGQPFNAAASREATNSEEDSEEASAVNINNTDARGCTPLVWACRNGHDEVVSYLIESGAEVDFKSYGGMTALHHACNSSNESCIQKLVDGGADVNLTDECGNSSLIWAASRGVLNIVVLLTSAGAEPNSTNNAGIAPLHKACIYGQYAVVKKLLDLGADPMAQDNEGNTGLHFAARVGFKNIVSYLLQNGATEGKSAYDSLSLSLCRRACLFFSLSLSLLIVFFLLLSFGRAAAAAAPSILCTNTNIGA